MSKKTQVCRDNMVVDHRLFLFFSRVHKMKLIFFREKSIKRWNEGLQQLPRRELLRTLPIRQLTGMYQAHH